MVFPFCPIFDGRRVFSAFVGAVMESSSVALRLQPAVLRAETALRALQRLTVFRRRRGPWQHPFSSSWRRPAGGVPCTRLTSGLTGGGPTYTGLGLLVCVGLLPLSLLPGPGFSLLYPLLLGATLAP